MIAALVSWVIIITGGGMLTWLGYQMPLDEGWPFSAVGGYCVGFGVSRLIALTREV